MALLWHSSQDCETVSFMLIWDHATVYQWGIWGRQSQEGASLRLWNSLSMGCLGRGRATRGHHPWGLPHPINNTMGSASSLPVVLLSSLWAATYKHKQQARADTGRGRSWQDQGIERWYPHWVPRKNTPACSLRIHELESAHWTQCGDKDAYHLFINCFPVKCKIHSHRYPSIHIHF